MGNGFCVVLKLDVCSPPGFWAGGALLGTHTSALPLHDPAKPLSITNPQLRVGMCWSRAGTRRGDMGTAPAQHLPNPEKLLPHDRARQPCCWGRAAGRCVRRCQIRAAALAVGTRHSSGPGCGVSSSCLFLPLLASFPSPNKVFVKMPQLSAGDG